MLIAEAWKVSYGKTKEKILDIHLDTKPTCTLDMFCSIIPFDIYSCKFFACPIFCNLVVLLEDIAQVMDMPFTNVLNIKIVQE